MHPQNHLGLNFAHRLKGRQRIGDGGFTLVELLVVTGIIGLLISMLMPALAKAREAANRTSCLSNMHQIALGLFGYVSNYRGWMPATTNRVYNFGDPDVSPELLMGAPNGAPNFMSAAFNYKIHVCVCPSVTNSLEGSVPGYGYAPTQLSDTNYLANAVVFARPLSQVPHSGQIIMLDESDWRSNAALSRPFAAYVNDANHVRDYYGFNLYSRTEPDFSYSLWHDTVTNPGYECLDVHNHGVNVMFVDGHGELRKYRDLRSKDFGLLPDEPWSMTNSYLPDSSGHDYSQRYRASF